MKLSIIIISYNEAEYLREAIDSCLLQNVDFDFEIIIGDDGSNDGSLEIIKEYHKKYPNKIKYYVMDRTNILLDTLIPSFRVSDNIKQGLAISKGEYISILSGDDYYCDLNKFQREIYLLETNPKYAAIYSNFKYIYPSGEETNIYINSNSNKLIWGSYYIHISTFIFRRKVWSNNLLLPNFCDDTGMMYSILSYGKVICDKSITFCYRQRERSIMHESDDLELNVIELLLYDDILSFNNKLNISSIARFFKPMRNCYKRKNEIKSNKKYQKYMIKNNSLIEKIINLDESNYIKKIKFNIFLGISYLIYLTYKIVRIMNKLVKGKGEH